MNKPGNVVLRWSMMVAILWCLAPHSQACEGTSEVYAINATDHGLAEFENFIANEVQIRSIAMCSPLAEEHWCLGTGSSSMVFFDITFSTKDYYCLALDFDLDFIFNAPTTSPFDKKNNFNLIFQLHKISPGSPVQLAQKTFRPGDNQPSYEDGSCNQSYSLPPECNNQDNVTLRFTCMKSGTQIANSFLILDNIRVRGLKAPKLEILKYPDKDTYTGSDSFFLQIKINNSANPDSISSEDWGLYCVMGYAGAYFWWPNWSQEFWGEFNEIPYDISPLQTTFIPLLGTQNDPIPWNNFIMENLHAEFYAALLYPKDNPSSLFGDCVWEEINYSYTPSPPPQPSHTPTPMPTPTPFNTATPVYIPSSITIHSDPDTEQCGYPVDFFLTFDPPPDPGHNFDGYQATWSFSHIPEYANTQSTYNNDILGRISHCFPNCEGSTTPGYIPCSYIVTCELFIPGQTSIFAEELEFYIFQPCVPCP